MKLIWFLCICLSLICVTNGRSVVESDDCESESSDELDDLLEPPYDYFKKTHIIDRDQGSPEAWKKLLCTRLKKKKCPYGIKRLNSFLVNAKDAEIELNFPDGVKKYEGKDAKPNEYWSDSVQTLFILVRIGKAGAAKPDYDVYNCAEKYYAAAINAARQPIHYVGHSKQDGPKKDGETEGCTKIVPSPAITCDKIVNNNVPETLAISLL